MTDRDPNPRTVRVVLPNLRPMADEERELAVVLIAASQFTRANRGRPRAPGNARRQLAERRGVGVEAEALTRAVRRNQDRLPDDFMFQLTNDEWMV